MVLSFGESALWGLFFGVMLVRDFKKIIFLISIMLYAFLIYVAFYDSVHGFIFLDLGDTEPPRLYGFEGFFLSLIVHSFIISPILIGFIIYDFYYIFTIKSKSKKTNIKEIDENNKEIIIDEDKIK